VSGAKETALFGTMNHILKHRIPSAFFLFPTNQTNEQDFGLGFQHSALGINFKERDAFGTTTCFKSEAVNDEWNINFQPA
jgi:hypothetical protein